MSIVLLGELSAAAYETWRGHLCAHLPAGESLVSGPQCKDKGAVDVALAANPPWGELASYPNLRFVQSLWAGVDRLLGDPALPRNITIARLIDPAMAQSMVEAAVAAAMFVHRQLPAYLQQQHHRTWRQLAATRGEPPHHRRPRLRADGTADVHGAGGIGLSRSRLGATSPQRCDHCLLLGRHRSATTDPATAAPIAVQNVVAFRAGRPLTGLVSRSLGY